LTPGLLRQLHQTNNVFSKAKETLKFSRFNGNLLKKTGKFKKSLAKIGAALIIGDVLKVLFFSISWFW